MTTAWYTNEVKAFIEQNLNADPHGLVLNPPAIYKESIQLIAEQLISRKKLQKKFPGWFQNFDLLLPPPSSVEQASSWHSATYKSRLLKGEKLIDLTGGMGIDTSVLSRHFQQTIYLEQNTSLAEIFDYNQNILKLHIEVINSTAEAYLAENVIDKCSVYIDPLRRNDASRFFKLEDCLPNLLELYPKLIQAKEVLIKLSPLVDLHSLIQQMPAISQIHVVSIKNDCKEVLALLSKSSDKPQIHAVNLDTAQPFYAFNFEEEKGLESTLGVVKDYIYEPNASILKAGAFKKVGIDFKLDKLHANTHLYTSDKVLENFPGSIFQVIDQNITKKKAKERGIKQLNTICRNYIRSANELKKEWKIKDGGSNFLIAFKNVENKPQTVLCRRIT